MQQLPQFDQPTQIPIVQKGDEILVLDSPFARKLTAYVALSPEDLDVLSDLFRRRRRFAVGRDMIHQGQADQPAYILADGWACGYIILPNGGRQIIDIKVPGDFLGMRSVLFRTSDHNIEPITPVEASEVTASDLINAFSKTPRLATAVLWAVSRDEAILVEHLVGQRDALQSGRSVADSAARKCPMAGERLQPRVSQPVQPE